MALMFQKSQIKNDNNILEFVIFPEVIPLSFKFLLNIFNMFNQQEVSPYILPPVKTGRPPVFFFDTLFG
jgi:hypothetical protein